MRIHASITFGGAAAAALALHALRDHRQQRTAAVPLSEARGVAGAVRIARSGVFHVVEQPFLRGVAEPLGCATNAFLEWDLTVEKKREAS